MDPPIFPAIRRKFRWGIRELLAILQQQKKIPLQ
jgi:hypothetical protein